MGQGKNNYYKHGIKTFWLDEAEPEVHPQQPGHLKYYLGNGAQVAQLYPYYYAKTFYDGLKASGEDEIISLTRAAYPGSQKFGAIVWNGDIPSTFEILNEYNQRSVHEHVRHSVVELGYRRLLKRRYRK